MIDFSVPGSPVPQGSGRALRLRRGPRRGKGVVIPDNEPALYAYRAALGAVARRARRAAGVSDPFEGPVRLVVTFTLARPKTVRRALPHVRPDLDKLARAVGDALKGILYVDDGQVVQLSAWKVYGGTPETRITLETL